jgi:predicted lipoprotein with Yx(FWY)xxD motif
MEDEVAGRRTSRCAVGVLAIVLLAGCGSGASGSGPSSAAPAAGVSAGTSAVAASGPVVVAATTGPLGVYLVDGAGRTLYLFEADSGGTSSCVDACATTWPPLMAVGKPTTSAGAAADKLATAARSDGSPQVSYAGHLLYYFAGDEGAGQTNGEGNDGKWWIVGPDGNPIKPGSDQGDNGSDDMPGGGY